MAARDIEAGRASILVRIRDQFTQGLKLAERRFAAFGAFATKTGLAMTALGAGGLAWPLKLSADMETASVSLEVFTGNANVAKKLIQDIETLGANTPFQFDELMASAKMLLQFGMGAKSIIPALKALGDVSGGDAEKLQRLTLAFGQVLAKGRLMGQEVMQMTENGFNPLQEMSRTTGKSVKSLMEEMEKGALSAQMVANALMSATSSGGRFFGMMDKQSQTLIGLFSTLMDYTKMAAREVGDVLAPMFKRFISVGITAAKTTALIVRNFKETFRVIGVVLTVVAAIGAAFIGIGLLGSALALVLGTVAAGWGFIAYAVSLVFSPFGILLGLFAAAGVAAIVYRKIVWEIFMGIVAWLQPVIQTFLTIYSIGVQAIGGIVAALESGDIEAAGNIAMLGLKTIIWKAATIIPGIGAFMSTGFGHAIAAGRWDLAAAIAMANVRLVIVQGWNAVEGFWSQTITGLKMAWTMFTGGLVGGFQIAINGIANGLVFLWQQFHSLLTKIQPAMEAIGQGDAFANLLKGMDPKGIAEKMQQMQRQQSDERNAALTRDLAGQAIAEQNAMQARLDREKAVQADIAKLNNEGHKAAAAAGVMTAEDAFAKSQLELNAAIEEAKKGKKDPKIDASGINVGPGAGANGKTAGTFTAAAAALFGAGTNDAAEETADNTKQMVDLLKLAAKRPGGQFV